jgi:tetratricopeptide (TPR) repeat protein
MPQSFRELLEFIKKIGAGVLAIGGFLTGVVGFIKFWRNEQSLVWLLILVCGVGILWLICFYVFFSRTPREKTVGFQADVPERGYSFSRNRRYVALLGVFLIPIFCVAGVLSIRHFRSLPSEKTIIMVANFESLDGQNYGVTEKILEQLRSETERFSDVEIKAAKDSVTAQDGRERARSIAAENKATVFLWGWYRKTTDNVLITVHVELLRKPSELILKSDSQELVVPAKQLDSFELQARLSSELTYLTLLTIGLARMESGNLEDAISLFTRAIQLAAVPETLVDPANIYFFRANCYLLTNSYQNAVDDFTLSLKITPENSCTPCAFNNRGIAYLELSNLDAALSDFLESARHDPTPAGLHNNIGVVYERKGDFENAIQAFTDATKRDQKLATAFRHLGNLYFKRKQYDKAVENLSELLNIEPNDWEALYIRGMALSRLGNYSQAVDDLNRARLIRPDTTPSFEGRKTPINKQLFLDDMRKYNQTLMSNPNSLAAYIGRATLCNSVFDYERAKADLDKAVALDPESEEGHHQRGKANEGLGLKKEAIADFEAFLRLAATDERREDATEHLKRLGVSR